RPPWWFHPRWFRLSASVPVGDRLGPLLRLAILGGQLGDLAGDLGQLIALEVLVPHERPGADPLAAGLAPDPRAGVPDGETVDGAVPDGRHLVGRLVHRALVALVAAHPVAARDLGRAPDDGDRRLVVAVVDHEVGSRGALDAGRDDGGAGDLHVMIIATPNGDVKRFLVGLGAGGEEFRRVTKMPPHLGCGGIVAFRGQCRSASRWSTLARSTPPSGCRSRCPRWIIGPMLPRGTPSIAAATEWVTASASSRPSDRAHTRPSGVRHQSARPTVSGDPCGHK